MYIGEAHTALDIFRFAAFFFHNFGLQLLLTTFVQTFAHNYCPHLLFNIFGHGFCSKLLFTTLVDNSCSQLLFKALVHNSLFTNFVCSFCSKLFIP